MFTKLSKATLTVGLTLALAACGGGVESTEPTDSGSSTASVGESVDYKIQVLTLVPGS
jgi:hypothetical protein